MNTEVLMETRTLAQQLATIEQNLQISAGKLQTTLLDPIKLKEFEQDLDSSFNSRINSAFNNIINTTFINDESDEIASFMQAKHEALNVTLKNIYDTLLKQKQAHIDAQANAIKQCMQQILAAYAEITNNSTIDPDDARRDAKVKIKSLLHDLENNADNSIEAFELDRNAADLFRQLKMDIFQADEDIDKFKNAKPVAEKVVITPDVVTTQPELTLVQEANIPTNVTPLTTPTFWERHPVFKKSLIGAAVGLAIVAVVAIIITALMFTGGAAAAPLVAFAGLLSQTLGLAGAIVATVATGVTAIGASMGLGAAVGQGQEHQKSKQVIPVRNSSTASTSFINQHLAFENDTKSAQSFASIDPLKPKLVATTAATPILVASTERQVAYSPGLRRR
jgi:hypothetical protein